MQVNPVPIRMVQLVQLVAKARKHLPENHRKNFPGVTWFSERDRWMYLESEHQNMCDHCHEYDQDVFKGDKFLQEFPWCVVIDDNYISPKVHPNCHCGAVRLFSLEEDASEYIEVIRDVPEDEPLILNEVGRPEDGYKPREIETVLVDRDKELWRLTGYENIDKNINVRVEVLAQMNNDNLEPDAIDRLLAQPEEDMQAMLEGMTFVGYITPVLMQELMLYRLYLKNGGKKSWQLWRQQKR